VPPPVRHDLPLVGVFRRLHFGVEVHVNRVVLEGSRLISTKQHRQ
jgi:hypothetical protein